MSKDFIDMVKHKDDRYTLSRSTKRRNGREL